VTDRDTKLCDVAVLLKHETMKAYLVNDGANDVWLPKSMVEVDGTGSNAIVTMPEWLAKEKGLL
jgi:hypothetical protein